MSKERKLDQFYTKRDIAELCLKIINDTVNNIDDYFFIEPSAWNWSFFNLFKNNILWFDIDPKNNDIIKQDFFELNIGKYKKQIGDKKIITIWNPPFWKNSSLALKFVNQSAKYSEYIAFILPKTFRKTSMLNRVNDNLFLEKELELPKNSFIFNWEEYNVPCVFQIWKKNLNKKRKKIILPIIHNDFIFVKKIDNPDFAIRRVGVKAWTLYEDNYMKYSHASHYYIKMKTKNIKQFLDKYKKINWSNCIYNTSWNPSLSKTELIEEYSKQDIS